MKSIHSLKKEEELMFIHDERGARSAGDCEREKMEDSRQLIYSSFPLYC